MKHIVLNAVFIGGVLPMIFFGTLNFMQKPITAKISTPAWIFGLVIGGSVIALVYSYFFEGGTVLNDFTKKEFLYALVGGIIWSAAVLAFGIAYKYYEANASQIVPIAMASSFVTVLLSIIILNEPVVIWKVITGAVLIFIGALFLI